MATVGVNGSKETSPCSYFQKMSSPYSVYEGQVSPAGCISLIM